MAAKDIDREYEQLVKKSELRGETETEIAEGERRRHIRLRVDAAQLEVEKDPWVFPINLSPAGFAFFSENPFSSGQQVTIALESGPSVAATVVKSQMEEAGEEGLMGQHRVSCAFLDEAQGKALLLEIKQQEERQLENASS